MLAIASFGEGNHDEPPRYRGSVCSRQSREPGCRPSSPFGWKSLSRIAQPLTFSVASQAPPKGSHLSAAGHGARFAYKTPAATLLIDLLGQDCASAAWFRGNAAHNPERLEPCQTPQETPQVETPRPCVSTRPETPAHRFTRLTPRHPVKRRLGSRRARPARHPNLATRATTGQRCFRPTRALHVFQRRAPGLREVIGSPEGLPMRPFASRLGPCFRWLSWGAVWCLSHLTNVSGTNF